jgi:hypothetical protein
MTNLSRAIVFLSISLFFIVPVIGATNACIDINTAPQEELEKIKHIGESRAKQIIILREEKLFSSVDELDRVIGIGPARISDIKQEGLACVQTQAPATEEVEVQPIKDDPPIIATSTAEIQPQKIYPAGVIFNEILPSPEGKDETEEWIELFNKNEFEVDLSGWQISDIAGSMTVYTFPEGTKIKQKGFLLISRPESKITLNNSGDGLKLMQPNGNVLDSINYENAPMGNSYNLIDGKRVWSGTLTPNSANILSSDIKGDKTIAAEEKNNLDSSSAEKQLASAEKQILESKNLLPPFLAALTLAIISGISILFFKKKVKEEK